MTCWTLMFLKWDGKYYWKGFGIESSSLTQEGACVTTPINRHSMVIWALCYRAGCAITKYHRLVALTTEICFLTTLEAGSLRPNVDRVDVCWELPLGSSFSVCAHTVFPRWLCRGKKWGGWREGEKERSLGVSFFFFAAAAAKSLQLCPTLGDPIDGSPPGSPVPEILQVKTLGGLPFPSPLLFFLPKFKSSWLYDHRNTINIHSWWTLL